MARILIIEDNSHNLSLMAYLLTASGHEPVGRRDGKSGLEAARSDPPDLVLCDIQLPQVSGYQIADSMRSDPALRNVPLIAVTALAMRGDRERALAAGFQGYIEKPVDPESFVAQVEEHLPAGLRKGPRAAVVNPPPSAAPAVRAMPNAAVILVVDDLVENLILMRAILEGGGHQVQCARDLDEALAAMRASPPSLVVSDVHMPGGGGFALRRSAIAEAALAAIPFIFISSSVVNEQDRQEARRLGAARLIERPIEPRLVLELIAAVLAGNLPA